MLLFFKNKFYLFLINLFIFGCAGSLLLWGFYIVAMNGGYSRVSVCGLLIAVASLVADHGL